VTLDDLAVAHVRPGERIRWVARPSLLGLAPILLGGAAATLGGWIGPFLVFGAEPEAFGLATFAMLIVFGFLPAVGKRVLALVFSRYVVTEERVYAITSFVSVNVQSVPLSRLSRVTVSQGPILNWFDLWTATISAYGEAGTTIVIPAFRDGGRLLAETSDGIERGANVAWIVKGD